MEIASHALVLRDQSAIHKDAILLRTKAREEKFSSLLYANGVTLMGADNKLIALNQRQREQPEIARDFPIRQP